MSRASFRAWLDRLGPDVPGVPLGTSEAWLATANGWVRVANPPEARQDLVEQVGGESAYARHLIARELAEVGIGFDRLLAAASVGSTPAQEEVREEVQRMRVAFEMLRRAMPPTLVSIDDAARAMGVSVSTVRRRVRDGSLPSRKLGRVVRVDLAAFRPPDAGEIADLARKALDP